MKLFSFVILTFNEEIHLPRLLQSIQILDAPTFVLDSGSTDHTLEICEKQQVKTAFHPFENHPKQWDFALKTFNIKTPWVICLDADQQVSPELLLRLKNFDEQQFADVNGIYFNRKNYFKGRWIKHGGYYPFYLLKMFRREVGFSDLNENMDHRFIAPGKTAIWKDGYLNEENLKENQISFWIAKHNIYSGLVAGEEVERLQKLRQQTLKPKFGGTPDERTAWLKNIWWKLPRYWRPTLYFLYRLIFQLGFLDGKKGIIFHFLQGFWFRIIVDIKIDELLEKQAVESNITKQKKPNKPIIRFAASFLFLFALFYYFNLYYNGLMKPGGNYNTFLSQHFNYIQWLRNFLLNSSSAGLQLLGYQTKINDLSLLAVGHGKINLAYDCLGLGVMSFLTAFAITYPAKATIKRKLLVACIVIFQFLNILRFMLLALYWKGAGSSINHHTIFNLFIYTLILITLYYLIEKSTVKEALT